MRKKISNFEKKYRFSEEEEKEVCDLYVQSKGDLEFIMDNIPLCTSEDYPRFVEIINKAIKEKKVKKYKKFNSDYKEAMKVRKDFEEKERKKFEKAQAKEKKKDKENQKDNIDDLALIIQNNRKRRLDDTLNNIFEKYSKTENKKRQKSNKKGSKKSLPEEPSEEEFLKLQEKLFGKKK